MKRLDILSISVALDTVGVTGSIPVAPTTPTVENVQLLQVAVIDVDGSCKRAASGPKAYGGAFPDRPAMTFTVGRATGSVRVATRVSEWWRMRRLLVRGLPPVMACLLLAACATQPDPGYHSAPGFFAGIWHGLVAPLALVAGIVTDARIYAFPNTGWWYDFGYMLGLTAWAGSGATAAGRHGR